MRRYRRLLALVALSLLLHLVVIGWMAHRPAPAGPTVLEAPPAPLALRLQPPSRTVPPAPLEAAIASTPTRVRPAPAIKPALRVPEVADLTPTSQEPPLPASTPTPLAPEPAPASTANAPVQMPSHYRTRIPDAVTLTYTVTRPAQPPAQASLRWQFEAGVYTLQSTGVTGTLSSQGVNSDAGIAPREASEQRLDGSMAATTFADQEITINGHAYPDSIGSQDRASLLMQLVAIGLADPDQIKGVIAVYVAGADEPEIQKFQVVGEEEVATPMGSMAARHLVQLVVVGAPRLEIWLAVEKGWLPVQLRLTAPDGTVSTQTVTAIGG